MYRNRFLRFFNQKHVPGVGVAICIALFPTGVTPLGVIPPGVKPLGVAPPGVKLPGVPPPGVIPPGVMEGVMAPAVIGVSSHLDLRLDTDAEGVSSILSSPPLLALGVSAHPE